MALAFSLFGCATATQQNPDPYQGYNEGMYRFNTDFNRAFLTPVTDLYRDVTFPFIRHGISNFFQNVATVPDMVNDLLQGNWRYFLNDAGRLFLNTFLGLFGLVDVAGHAGLHAHPQGFGYTLYKWGFLRHSPYFVMPFFGPNTVRSSIGLVPDYFLSPLTYVKPWWLEYSLKGLNLLQKATDSLPKLHFITRDAINPYIAVRNAYLQNQKLVLKQIMTDGQYQGSTAVPLNPYGVTDQQQTVKQSEPSDEGQMSPLLQQQNRQQQESEEHQQKHKMQQPARHSRSQILAPVKA